MWDFFTTNIYWFIGVWYLGAFIVATVISSYLTYDLNEKNYETLGIFYLIAFLSPLIIPITGIALLFSPLLIPWFVTRRIVLKSKRKQEQIKKVKE